MNEEYNFNEIDNYINSINAGQDGYRDPNFTYAFLDNETRRKIDYANTQTKNDNDFKFAKAIYNGAIVNLGRGLLGGLKMFRDVNVAKHRETDPDYEPLDISYNIDRALASDHLKPYNIAVDNNNKLEQFGLNLAAGAGQLVRQIAVGLATGGTGNLALMGAEIAGNQYLELTDKGVNPERAMYASLTNAAVQAPMERLSLGKLMKAIPKGSPLRQQILQVVEKTTTEGLTEFLQQYPEEITNMVALNENMSNEELLELSKQNVGKWTVNAVEAGIIGSILGGTVGGVQMGFQRMAHENQVKSLKESADYARKAGVDSQTIANVTNANTDGMSVDVDAETLLGYMQEHEDASDILGMTVEDVQQAAAAGASVDLLLGNVQAMEAKHGDFLNTVSDDMAFNDGGYTPSNERIQREMKKAYAQQAQTDNELTVQMNDMYDQMVEAGISKRDAAGLIQIYEARAKAYRPYEPTAYFKEHPLSFKNGQVVDGYDSVNVDRDYYAPIITSNDFVDLDSISNTIAPNGNINDKINELIRLASYKKIINPFSETLVDLQLPSAKKYAKHPFRGKSQKKSDNINVRDKVLSDFENLLSKAILIEIRPTVHGKNRNKNTVQLAPQPSKGVTKASTINGTKQAPGTVNIPSDWADKKCSFKFVIPVKYGGKEAVAVVVATGTNKGLLLKHNSAVVYEIYKNKINPLAGNIRTGRSHVYGSPDTNGFISYSIADLLQNVNDFDSNGYVDNGKVNMDPDIVAYFQKDGVMQPVVKGSIGWDDHQAIISIFKSGDSSTAIHESGHFFVENLARDVNSGNATEQEVKDWNTLLKYAGMTNEQWMAADMEGRRAAHERFAEAFESYIMEGKAPSMELRNVFKKFASWLKNVYSTIARNDNAVPINDDVRQVFDRMLAAEDDIAEMERVNGYFAKLPKVITDNMSESTKKRLEDVIQKAHDKAVEMLTKEAMVNFTPERRAKIQAYKESIRAEVEEQVHQQPLYTASQHIVEAIGEGKGTAKSWSKKYLNANGKEFDNWKEEKAEVDSTIASILDPIIELLKEGAGASEKTNYKVNPDTNEIFYEGMEGYDAIDPSYGAKNQVMHEGRQDWYQEYTQGRKLSNKAYEEWARAIASGEDVPAPMEFKMMGAEAGAYFEEQKAELDRLFERREQLEQYAADKKAAYNSKIANSLADAMELDEKGVALSKIKKMTGWDKSEGVWKYQLGEGEFHYDKLPEGGKSVKLKDVYDNADLYKLLPDLKNVELDVVAELDNGARFSVERRGFTVAKNVAEGADNNFNDVIAQMAEQVRGKDIDLKATQIKLGDNVVVNYDAAATAWRFTGMKEDMRMVYDIIAEEMGYSSGDEMAKAVLEAPTEHTAVNQEIDARAKQQFPDINADRQTAMDAAREALYNDDSGLVIGVEQTIIEDAAAGMLAKQRSAETKRALAMAKKQAAENAAKTDIAKMSIKDAIRVKKYIAAERSAANKAAAAMAKKDYEKALMYKDMQAYQHALVRESVKTKLTYERGLKLVKKQFRAKRETWYKEDHFVQAAGLLNRMGLLRKDFDPSLKVTTLADYMTAMQEEFDVVDIADWLVDEGAYIPAPMDLTLDQFNDVVDALRNIKAIARADKGVNMFNAAADWAETRDKLMEQLDKMPTRWEADVNKDTEPSLLERQDASLLNLDTFFERLDGWKQGLFSKLFGESIVKANDKEASMMWDYQERITNAFKRWLPDTAAEAEANTEKYYEELGTSVDRHVLVRMLMNLGNRSGSEKLCAVAPDSTFAAFFPKSSLWVNGDVDATRINLLEFLGNVLNERDVRYAQDMLDASGMYWDELASLEKRTKGFSPVKVEPLPAILDMHGKSVVFNGGYLPLIRRRDTGSRPMSADALPATDSNRGAGIRTLHTNTGSTKHRDSSVYPIDLRRGVEFSAVQDSIHDICWRELMNDFRRAVNDRELYNEMKTKFGAAYFDVFTEMLKKSAQPYDAGNSFVSERESSRCLNWFRAKTVNVAIMLNLKVALQNLANPLLYGQSVEGFGYADALHAMGNMFSNYNKAGDYVSAKDFVFSKSIFMKERSVLPDVTLRDVKAQKVVKLSKLENLGIEWGAKLMAYTDNVSAVPVWMEAYNKKLKSGATEQDAILFADTVIRRTLGSSRINEVSAMQRGGPLQKLLTTFMSFFNTQFNQWRREVGIAHDLYATGAKGEAVRRLMAFAASKYVCFCMMNLMLALEDPFEDDDDGYKKITKELLHYPISMLGWQGGVANAILSNAIGERTYGYRLTSTEGTIERMINLAGKVGNVARGKSDVSSLAEPATQIAGIALGVPSQFNKLCWNAYDILVNDMDFEVRDLIVRRPRSERKEK